MNQKRIPLCFATLSTYAVFIFFACQLFLFPVYSAAATFFRRDYDFYKNQRAFYKVHTIPKCWKQARIQCDLEASTLAVPNTADEAEIFRNLMKKKIKTNSMAYLGIQAFSKGIFTSIDGIPIDDIYHEWAPGQPDDVNNEYCVTMGSDGKLSDINCLYKNPFICEKSQDSVTWNYACETSDLAYTRVPELEKCYKVHLEPKNWSEAYATCAAEQSYLAILNSKEESTSLVNLFNTKPHRYVTGNYLSGAIHLGYYDRFGEGVFRTLQGQTLTNAGFDKWAYMQPDHPRSEYCGSMFYNGELNDIGCEYRCFFICEREAGDGSSALSIRNANVY